MLNISGCYMGPRTEEAISSDSIPHRSNQLVGLPPELETCSNLRDVVLSFNRLRELPPILYRLAKLENIIASDNQVHPPGICIHSFDNKMQFSELRAQSSDLISLFCPL